MTPFASPISEGGPGCGAAPREKADGFTSLTMTVQIHLPRVTCRDGIQSYYEARIIPHIVPQPAQFHDHRDGSSGALGPPAHSIARARWCRSLVPPQSDIAQVARRALSAGGPLRWRGAYWCMSALASRTMACLAKERAGRTVVVFGAVFAVVGLATFAYVWWCARSACVPRCGEAPGRRRSSCSLRRGATPMRLSWARDVEALSACLRHRANRCQQVPLLPGLGSQGEWRGLARRGSAAAGARCRPGQAWADRDDQLRADGRGTGPACRLRADRPRGRPGRGEGPGTDR